MEELIKRFTSLESVLGIAFRDKKLLVQAFTHRSYVNEHRELSLEHNERLEFLGDAVLELIVTDYLFRNYPQKSEGELTSYRAALVNTNSLSMVASDLSMNDYLLLSRGEERDTGRARQYILANTFEAFIGALYLDQGYDASHSFLGTYLIPRIEQIIEQRLWQDAKSRFQEMAQEVVGVTPSYETLEEVGPDHDKRFVVGVYVNGTEYAKGEGRAKQEAEQDAARKALTAKGWQ